jgi:hypothetical protein
VEVFSLAVGWVRTHSPRHPVLLPVWFAMLILMLLVFPFSVPMNPAPSSFSRATEVLKVVGKKYPENGTLLPW